jgi:MFS family permease
MPGANDKLWTRDYILMAVGNLFMTVGFYFLLPTLPVYVVDVLGAHKHDVGYVLAAYTISALIIRPFTGIAVDIYGRRWIYLVSFAAFTLLLAAYPLMATFAALLALRFLHGFAWGVNTTAGSTAVVDIIPPGKRGQGIGYFGMSFTIAMALGPVIALTILGSFGFRAMFISAALFAASGLTLALFVRYPAIPRTKDRTTFSWRRFAEKSSLPVSVPHLLFGMTYGGVVSFITLYDKEHQFNVTGPFFLVIAAGIFISRMFAGQIFDRRGPYGLMIAGFSVSIAGYLLLALVPSINSFLFSAFLIGIGSGILMPTAQTMVNNIVGIDRRGAANATITTAFDLGIGMGALLLGFLADRIGFAGMYLSCTLLLAAGLIIFLAWVSPH